MKALANSIQLLQQLKKHNGPLDMLNLLQQSQSQRKYQYQYNSNEQQYESSDYIDKNIGSIKRYKNHNDDSKQDYHKNNRKSPINMNKNKKYQQQHQNNINNINNRNININNKSNKNLLTPLSNFNNNKQRLKLTDNMHIPNNNQTHYSMIDQFKQDANKLLDSISQIFQKVKNQDY